MSIDFDKILGKSGEKKGITPREAFENHVFDEIMEFRVKDPNGHQTFFSMDAEAIYDYFIEIGVEKFIPWTSFKIKGTWGFAWRWEFKFKRKKKRVGNIPGSKRESVDKKHANIKGQCTQRY